MSDEIKRSEQEQIKYLDKLSTNQGVRLRIAVLALKKLKDFKTLEKLDKVFSELDRK